MSRSIQVNIPIEAVILKRKLKFGVIYLELFFILLIFLADLFPRNYNFFLTRLKANRC